MKTETAIMGEGPKIVKDERQLYTGTNLTLRFEGEDYRDGRGPLDTTVEIDDGVLCCITWTEREKFYQELKAVIDKYAI